MAVRPDDQAAGGSSHDQQDREWQKVVAKCAAVVEKAKGESLSAVEMDMMVKGVNEAINAYSTLQEDRSAHDRKHLTETAELIEKLLPRLCEMQGSMALHRVELAERPQSQGDDSDTDDVSAPRGVVLSLPRWDLHRTGIHQQEPPKSCAKISPKQH